MCDSDHCELLVAWCTSPLLATGDKQVLSLMSHTIVLASRAELEVAVGNLRGTQRLAELLPVLATTRIIVARRLTRA